MGTIHLNNILIAHHNVVESEQLRIMAERVGLEVLQASTYAAAMESFNNVLPGLVIADIALPDTSGFELLRHIRSHPDPEARGAAVILIYPSPPTDPQVFLGFKYGSDAQLHGIKKVTGFLERIKDQFSIEEKEGAQ